MNQNYPNFIQEMLKTSYDMWSKGWAEANGGNISLRLKQEFVDEVKAIQPDLRIYSRLVHRFPDWAANFSWSAEPGVT